jgi:hypothetical protein
MADVNEILLEQLAEIRAQNAVLVLMLTGILEQQGADAEGTVTAIDNMTTEFANLFEDAVRRKAGMEPRAEPRKPVLKMKDDDPSKKPFVWKGNTSLN